MPVAYFPTRQYSYFMYSNIGETNLPSEITYFALWWICLSVTFVICFKKGALNSDIEKFMRKQAYFALLPRMTLSLSVF